MTDTPNMRETDAEMEFRAKFFEWLGTFNDGYRCTWPSLDQAAAFGREYAAKELEGTTNMLRNTERLAIRRGDEIDSLKRQNEQAERAIRKALWAYDQKNELVMLLDAVPALREALAKVKV